MNRHYLKQDFHGLSLLVVIFEALSAVLLIFGSVGAVYLMFDQSTNIYTFVFIAFGSIFAAIVTFSLAELIQLLMKIEINTRKSERLMQAAHKKAEKRRKK